MELPTEISNETPTPEPAQTTTPPKSKFSFTKLSLPLKVGFLGGIFLVILVLIISIVAFANSLNKTENSIPETNPQEILDEAKKQQAEKQQKEASASTPINQLQSAYSDVIGSNSVKRKLEINDLGVATIEYTIPSSDGQTVIKTSYENFADFAIKVFNISTVTRLNVTTYATKFTDKFGQPDQAALKLQVTRQTSAKINWPLKKFSYKDYATILDFHELNPLLQKDYENLTKIKKS